MKDENKKQSLGAGIKVLSVLNIIFSILGLGMGILALYSDEVAKSMQLSNMQLIMSCIFTFIMLVGVILILCKNEIGIYMFFGAEILSVIYSVITMGFNVSEVFSLIFPALYAYFIYKKRELFGFKK